jgi:hypothetical protein
LEAYSSSFSATFQILSQIDLRIPLPSILAIQVCYPAFLDHFGILGIRTFCDPITCDPTSPSPY